MTAQSYKAGDHVVYGTNGVCRLEEIRTCRLTPDLPIEDYYVLKPLHAPTSTLFVPLSSDVLCARLRPVLTKTQIDELIEISDCSEIEWIEDRKQRTAAFREILTRGDRCELIRLIRCLMHHANDGSRARRKLSSADSDILLAAERAVEEEFAFSLGIRRDDVAAYIRRSLGEED